jgi:hypothetical protein
MTVLTASGRPKYRVAICTPCQDTVSAGYAFDLASLTGQLPADITWTLFQSKGTILPQQRATLVGLAQGWTATHILWLDADMRFPVDTLTRLLAHRVPIVAANYPTRRVPIRPVAEHREHGVLLTTSEDAGLVEVTHCGMGVMLVDTEVYRTVPSPWFALGYHAASQTYAGEDVFFCRKASEAGFPTMVDQSLSQQVRHVGEFEFAARHAVIHSKPQVA